MTSEFLRRRTFLAMGFLCLAAAGLRLYRLGHWGFDANEINTLRDSATSAWLVGPKPLLFFLNHHLIGSWRVFDEFSLRLLPALFGVAAVPVLFWMVSRTLSTRAALFAALILTFHPWHLHWSQFARYYSLVFLASAFFPLAAYIAVRERHLGWGLAALGGAAVSVLAHPSSALLVGGVGCWTILTYGLELRRRADPRALRVGLLVTLTTVTVLVAYFAPTLVGWYRMGQDWGHQGPMLFLSFLDGISIALVLFALGGVAWLWQDGGNRPFVGFLVTIVIVPTIFLMALSYFVAVSNSYLLTTGPAYFIASAAFFAQLVRTDGGRASAKLSTALVVLVLLVTGAPRLWSHYRDGSRPDLRAAAAYVSGQDGGEALISDQWRVMQHYLPDRTVVRLERDPVALDTAAAKLIGSDTQRDLWLVAVRRWRGGFNEQDLGPAAQWAWMNCRLETVFSTSRLDYKQDEIQVYRCSPNQAVHVDAS